MIPFSRFNEYGNTVYHRWHRSPTTLVAYDSSIFSPNGFTDYYGNSMRVGGTVFAINGTSPSIGTGSPYGRGINLNTGFISTIKSSGGFTTDSWCVDMWMKQNISVTGGVASGTVLFVDNDISTTEFTTRFEIDFLNQTTIYQNSYNPSYKGTISTAQLMSTTFYHLAIQYLNKMLYIYKDGVLVENFYYEITGSTWKDLGIIGNLDRATPKSAYAVIDRYRLRTGQYFAVDGFDINGIYPGRRIS